MESVFKVTGYYVGICTTDRNILRKLAAFASTLQKAEELIKNDKCDKDLVYYRVEEYLLDKPTSYEVFPYIERVYDRNGELLSVTRGCNRTSLKKRFYEGEHVAVAQCDQKVITGVLVKRGKTFKVLTLDGYSYASMKDVFKREYNGYTEYERIELEKRLKKVIRDREDTEKYNETQEKIKSLCHCYHGEEDCPEEYLDTEKEYIWAAEMLLVKNNIYIVKKVDQEWFDTQIIEYFRNYDLADNRRTIAERYFELFPAPEYQDKVMKKEII